MEIPSLNGETAQPTPEDLAAIVATPQEATVTAGSMAREMAGPVEDSKSITKLPSLTSVISRTIGESAGPNRSRYSEENDSRFIGNAIQETSIVKQKLKTLGQKSPEERSAIGGKLGATIGLAMDGPVGALVGAGVGAMSARGMGLVQTGEQEDQQRKTKVIDSLNLMGVAKDNKVNFDDGSSFTLTTNPNAKLANKSAIFGQPDRSIFEIDKTSPFTKRTTSVARPLARFLSEGVLGYKDGKNPRDVNTLNNTTGLFVNMLQDNVDSIDSVYTRAKELSNKFGITEDKIRAFFDVNKGRIEPAEAAEIRKGLDLIYA